MTGTWSAGTDFVWDEVLKVNQPGAFICKICQLFIDPYMGQVFLVDSSDNAIVGRVHNGT